MVNGFITLNSTIGGIRVPYFNGISNSWSTYQVAAVGEYDNFPLNAWYLGDAVVGGLDNFSLIGKSGTLYPVVASHNSGSHSLMVKRGNENAFAFGSADLNSRLGIPVLIIGSAYYNCTSFGLAEGNQPSFYVFLQNRGTSTSQGSVDVDFARAMSINANAYTSGIVYDVIKDLVEGQIVEPTDPYGEGGETDEGGGDGTFSEEGTDVEVPELPQVTAVSTGFIKLFNPSLSQLNSLSTYMWGTGFDLNTFKKLFADPMDCILGLSIVPVNVPSGGSETVNIGNISTGISMTKAGSQFVEVDCGTINVTEYWGGFLDYEPYTKAEIYLPYIGTHAISADDIMGKSINVTYHVDILSGACVAYVSCGGTVLYNFIGQCSASIPVTSRDWTNVINGVMNIAGAIGSMVATGGASAPMQIAGVAATAVNSLKPNIEKSGAMGGTGGLMAIQKPYLILTRPRQAVPKNQNSYTGYPSYITTKLESIGGYTEIEHIHLENIPALGDELSEIESLLSKGVIF